MSVVHVALVGGQTMPVYLAIRESLADKFVLVHSSSTKKAAERLKKDVSADYGKPVEMLELEPNDYFKAKEQLEHLFSGYEGWAVEVNISSGTKPWSIAVAILSGKFNNIELIYVDQNSKIYNYMTGNIVSVGNLSIAEIFKYNQQTVHSYVKLSDYTEEDLELLPKIMEIRDKFNDSFRALTIPSHPMDQTSLKSDVKGEIVDPSSCSEMTWNRNLNGMQQVKMYLVDRFGNHKNKEFCSPHALDMVAFAGWFEYEIAQLLSTWSGSREVWLNTVLPYNDNRNPKNEIDVIVNAGNRLLFVECKTQIYNQTDIDKFTTVVKNYGGLGAKAIFITDSNMKAQAVEKCETSKIAHFSLKDKRNACRDTKELFTLLDKIMFENNAR